MERPSLHIGKQSSWIGSTRTDVAGNAIEKLVPFLMKKFRSPSNATPSPAEPPAAYMKHILAGAALWLCLAGWTRAAEVEAEGKAAGDLPHAREEALADALREAVRVGIGVDVQSTTAVRDFSLEFDRVLSASFGHVSKYRVTQTSLGSDGIYRVKIRAEVKEGAPGMNETLALKQIAQLKQSPRLAFKIEEQIEGVATGKGYAAAWFEQTAQKMQLQVVDEATIAQAQSRRASRDEVLGRRLGANFRRAAVDQRVDFIIEGKVDGKYAGTESLFGALPEHCFELGAELRAIRPETGEVVASVVVPVSDKHRSGLQNRENAAREALFRCLDGGKGTAGGMALFSKIFARWLVEVDCGAIKQVEFEKISARDFQKVQLGLKTADKVSAVWAREFDSKAVSHLDVETRLNALDLAAVIEGALQGGGELDRSTENFLQFTAKAASRAAASGSPPPVVAPRPEKQSPLEEREPLRNLPAKN
jgi:hypothetical protein